MTAAYRLKSVGWFVACTAVVLAFYLVSLQVASERKKLEALNGSIATTRRDIRALETEFDTRANLAQLERWNGDTLALAAPRPAQFVHDEAELAATDPRGPTPGGAEVTTAALVVPTLPVPAAPLTPPGAPAVVRAMPAPVRMAAAGTPSSPRAPVHVAEARTPAPARAVAVAYHPAAAHSANPLRGKPEVAMLDHHLLSDATLGDLIAGARTEKGRGR